MKQRAVELLIVIVGIVGLLALFAIFYGAPKFILGKLSFLLNF
ncbi:MAG: hypothetical protein UW53_C0027G0012 [Candidatus Giovannonibacteria bacterium GW2011_GWA1_44_25]|uniref:Uncharacterized protein n=1 Tax=Candidatus Giovannonibacteria bacterium GW2011_GWA1_44_25 TaxID=1618645 RepID=A0A0G1KRK2_9BACT|nr:MAG: hypothetical protein UW53_C0027G0012 [Candidatus Giovannonibacteria bacterium GW2011_GWA1_44_25]